MNDPDRKALRAVRTAKNDYIRRALGSVAAGQLDAAAKHLEAADVAAKVLAANERDRSRLWSVSIGLICVLLILFGMTFRIRNTTVIVHLRTDGLAARLADSLPIATDLVTRSVLLEDVDSVQLDDPAAGVMRGETVGLRGEQVQVRSLAVSSGALLEIEYDYRQLRLFVRDGNIHGRFALRRGVLEVEGNREQAVDVPRRQPPMGIELWAAMTGREVVPARLSLELPDSWELPEISVTAVGFEAEQPAGSGEFRSTIRGGTVTIYESGRVVEMPRGESMDLQLAEAATLVLSDAGGELGVLLRGSASRIASGRQNHKPNYLEFLYHNKRVAFIWTAAGFLWGLLWAVKKSFLP